MIAYNVTTKLFPSIESDWVKWYKEEHIPDIMSSGKFTDHRFYKLIEEPAEDGISYIAQFFASSLDDYHAYIDQYATTLRNKAYEKWGNQFISFRTIMQIVN